MDGWMNCMRSDRYLCNRKTFRGHRGAADTQTRDGHSSLARMGLGRGSACGLGDSITPHPASQPTYLWYQVSPHRQCWLRAHMLPGHGATHCSSPSPPYRIHHASSPHHAVSMLESGSLLPGHKPKVQVPLPPVPCPPGLLYR